MLDISFGASNIKPISGKHPCRKYQITLRRLVEITTNSYTERDAAQRTNTRQCADLKIHIHNVVLSIHTIPYIVTDKAHILDWFLNNVQFVVAFLSMCWKVKGKVATYEKTGITARKCDNLSCAHGIRQISVSQSGKQRSNMDEMEYFTKSNTNTNVCSARLDSNAYIVHCIGVLLSSTTISRVVVNRSDIS